MLIKARISFTVLKTVGEGEEHMPKLPSWDSNDKKRERESDWGKLVIKSPGRMIDIFTMYDLRSIITQTIITYLFLKI